MNHKLVRFPNGTEGCLHCGVSVSSRRYQDPCAVSDDRGYIVDSGCVYTWDAERSFKNFVNNYIGKDIKNVHTTRQPTWY